MCSNSQTKKKLTIMGYDFVYVYFVFIIAAFLGWFIENCVRVINFGIIDSRYHFLPFISPYGLVIFAMLFFVGNPNDFAFFGKKLFKEKTKKSIIISNILTYVFLCCVVFFGELIIGNFWYNISGVKLWDYTALPFKVTIFAGLIPTIGYGSAGFVVSHLLNPVLTFLQNNMNYKVALIIDCTLGVLIVLDTCIECLTILIFKYPPMRWSFYLR